MHVLDSKITEIEERIEEVIEFAPQQEGPTMQETVLSYGWILLDSWIAWRTLRFLLRSVSTIQTVQEKWLQTPSSYNASQLGAVWGFTDITVEYFKNTLGKNSNQIFNDLIQKKRNASAHFAPKSTDTDSKITGTDTNIIQKLYKGLSTAFLFYESKEFWKDVQLLLTQKGYGELSIVFHNSDGADNSYYIDSLDEALKVFDRDKGYKVQFLDTEGRICVIAVENNYCKAARLLNGDKIETERVLKTKEDKYYNLLNNKGYYVYKEEFVNSIEDALRRRGVESPPLGFSYSAKQ